MNSNKKKPVSKTFEDTQLELWSFSAGQDIGTHDSVSLIRDTRKFPTTVKLVKFNKETQRFTTIKHFGEAA